MNLTLFERNLIYEWGPQSFAGYATQVIQKQEIISFVESWDKTKFQAMVNGQVLEWTKSVIAAIYGFTLPHDVTGFEAIKWKTYVNNYEKQKF